MGDHPIIDSGTAITEHMAGSKLTRARTIRYGIDYQDLVAAEAMLQILKHPSRYKWVKLEVREAGKLDDVLVLWRSGLLEAMQVKASPNPLKPDTYWTWETLLKPSKSRRSLIQDWCNSVNKLEELYDEVDPKLYSNRRCGNGFYLGPDGLVDQDRTDHEQLECIASQLGEYASDFLKRFRFQVDEQDLPEYDERLRREFQVLGVFEQGWLGLKDAIRSWIRCERLPPNGEIRLKDIQNACGWRQLFPLSQKFEVPSDYTLQLGFHEKFLGRVLQGDESTIVLTASPGSGKSTYLSYLVEKLKAAGQPVIRHHYVLQSTFAPTERFNARRVAESLMSDIQNDLSEYIAELPIEKPDPNHLRTWIAEVGSQLRESDKSLVVVIDGLDHVWRFEESRQRLTELFNQLIPLPERVVLIVGTQPVADQQLPVSLLTVAPREQWVTLPNLDILAVSEWLVNHDELMGLESQSPNRQFIRANVATALHAKTGGHPLLLRYVVKRITELGEPLTANSIQALPEEPTDSVETYYRSLWSSLSEQARDVLLLLALADFSWPRDALLRCLELAGYERGSSLNALSSIQHLLGRDALGWKAFHSSLLVFAKRRPELGNQETTLRDAILEWLERDAPDYWRRSYLWTMKFESGDDQPLLLGADRQWTVDAVAAGHPAQELTRVLQAAAWRAIEIGDFPTYVDRGILADVVSSVRHHDEATRWMLATRLLTSKDEYLEAGSVASIDRLSDSHVLELARHMHFTGKKDELKDCFEEINRRNRREIDDDITHTGREDWYLYTAELAGMVGVSTDRLVNFLCSVPSLDIRVLIAESWTSGLRRTREVHRAVEALGQGLDSRTERCLSRHVALQATIERLKLSADEFARLDPLYRSLYAVFHSRQPPADCLDEPVVPKDERSFSYEIWPMQISSYIHDLFFVLVVQEIQSPGSTEGWEPAVEVGPWLGVALARLADGARCVAETWLRDEEIPVIAAYDATSSIARPPLNSNLTQDRQADGFEIALQTITEDLLAFRGATDGDPKLGWEEVESIASQRFSGFRQLLRSIAEEKVDISKSTLVNFCASIESELASYVEPFSEHAEVYALLANVCIRHELVDKPEVYLRQAAENLIGYGYHKDLLLHTALRAIAAVAENSGVEKSWWLNLAPLINAVEKFTDGDETRYLPAQFGAMLLRFDPHLAVEYVNSRIAGETSGDVGDMMAQVMRYGDLVEPAINALYSTLVKSTSIGILEELAGNGDEVAEEMLRWMPVLSDAPPVDVVAANAADQTPHDNHRNGGEPADQNWHLEYPPEILIQLVREVAFAKSYELEDKLSSWLPLWSESERASQALQAAECHILSDDRIRISNETVLAARNLGGLSRSYPWLVRAQQSNRGWMEYWSSYGETKQRWRMLKRDFPEKWHAFLSESVRPVRGYSHWFGGTLAHLIEYLVFMGQVDDARVATTQLVKTICQLTSGQQLPCPEWATGEGGNHWSRFICDLCTSDRLTGKYLGFRPTHHSIPLRNRTRH